MRFPLASLFLLVGSFIFFMFWVFSSYLVNFVVDTMTPYATNLGEPAFDNLLTLLPAALGIMCALFFIVGILLIFVLDSLADEPEMYWRR